MVFQVKVKYNGYDSQEKEQTCIIYTSERSYPRSVFTDAMSQIEQYYGETLLHIAEFKILSDNNFLAINGHKDVVDEGDITV